MMKFLPSNTLSYFNAAPQVHRHDFSDVPTSVFSEATLKYRENCGETSPNNDAVSFYVLNHAASIVRKSFTEHETLPEWARQIMASYTDITMAQGERILHYILSITTREMRHLKTSGSSTAMWNKIKTDYTEVAVDYLKDIASDGNETTAVNKYMKKPPSLTVTQYTRALAYAFHNGSWSGGYGGHPWGEVTDAVISYLSGVTSMEMLVDTGYTLAHNGGPIFNKGMMYTHYDEHFMTILDVQRSGQLLDLLVDSNTHGVKKTPEATTALALVKLHRPEEFKGYVDWKLVDELRPEKDKKNNPNKYTIHIAAQAKAKQPSAPKAPKVAAKPKVEKPVFKTVAGKKAKVVGEWQVFPHQVVTQLERVGEA